MNLFAFKNKAYQDCLAFQRPCLFPSKDLIESVINVLTTKLKGFRNNKFTKKYNQNIKYTPALSQFYNSSK